MITTDQLVCHLVGDYILQSDWMAQNKTRKTLAALVHVFTYSIPFLILKPSILAMLFIIITHFIIDRWRLARFIVFIKNRLSPISYWDTWEYSKITGYPQDIPMWLSLWLLIIVDNTLHIICNGIAFKYL